MSYKLEERDSKYWLNASKMPKQVGPGFYEGANTTDNSWNRVMSRDSNRMVMSRGNEKSTVDQSYYGESDYRQQQGKNVPFNSKIERKDNDRLAKQFNPGPGTYQNLQKSQAFKYDYITKDNVQDRKIFS